MMNLLAERDAEIASLKEQLAQQAAEMERLKTRIAVLETPNQFWLVDGSCEPSMESIEELLEDAEPYKVHEVSASRDMALRWIIIVPPKDEEGPPEFLEFGRQQEAEIFLSRLSKEKIA